MTFLYKFNKNGTQTYAYKFSWKTTVNVDGHATSTPIEVEEPIA